MSTTPIASADAQRIAELEAKLAAVSQDAKRKDEAVTAFVAWLDAEDKGPDYGGLTRDTHPQGAAIWRAWFDNNMALCARATDLGRAAITPTESNR